MSIYDYRDKPAYRPINFDPQYARNPYILKWWTSEHDRILREEIAAKHWAWWGGNLTDEIVKVTNQVTLSTWKNTDPVCKRYVWYNVLLYFAGARANQLGFDKAIRAPQWKICPLCNQKFIEDSLPIPLIERLGGIDQLNFCSPCLRDTILNDVGNNLASPDDIKEYLMDLATMIGRVPTQTFGRGVTDLLDLNLEERIKLLKLLKNRPTINRVKEVYGSWLNALIQANVLEDGTRKTSRGIQTIAKDGHVCLSLGEKTIDDYLFAHGIHHEKEPRYPEGNYRGDFKVGEVFVEYFGLAGNLEYDARMKEKIHLCKKHKITLIAIFPEDLANHQKFENKLSVCVRQDEV